MEELIETVRKHKVIYDPTCKEYRNQSVRAAIWDEIGEKMKQPPEKCKEDWNRLRNSYINALKRRCKLKKSGEPAIVTPWKYEQMRFLRPFMESRSTKVLVPVSPKYITRTQSHNSESESRPSTPISGDDGSTQLHDLYDSQLKSSNDFNVQKQYLNLHDMDETDLFFLSMSKAVKGLPKLDRIKIKLDLHTAVSNSEIIQAQALIE